MPDTIAKQGGRQYPLVAKIDFTFADLAAGAVTATTIHEALDLPPGAMITGGGLNVTTAWVGPTAATASVGDGGSAARYLADTDLKAAAYTPLVPTGLIYTVEDSIDLDVASSVAVATAGEANLTVEYVISDRANEVQPV